MTGSDRLVRAMTESCWRDESCRRHVRFALVRCLPPARHLSPQRDLVWGVQRSAYQKLGQLPIKTIKRLALLETVTLIGCVGLIAEPLGSAQAFVVTTEREARKS